MIKNILIVDDEANLTFALEFLLSHAGFQVTTAVNYEQALATVQKTCPDMVLVDAMLPDRSGYDLCQTLLAMPGLAHLPVLMLTTRGLDVEREKALSLGAVDSIVKPFNPGAVLARVQELLKEAA
mgnify:FL=1